jgi:hypothetical protein
LIERGHDRARAFDLGAIAVAVVAADEVAADGRRRFDVAETIADLEDRLGIWYEAPCKGR